jgi:alkylhydroperoxidase family enzyme
LKEDEIAALDGDWAEFTPAQRAAFAFARKLSLEPHHISDTDIHQLLKYYNELQILEMTLSIAGNNAINRWKEGIGIPQEKEASRFLKRDEKAVPSDRPLPIKSFLTPTADEYKDRVTLVAPLQKDERTGASTRRCVFSRPALEPRPVVEKSLEAGRKRVPRLPLTDEASARELLSKGCPEGPLPQWMRLFANFPKDGKYRILSGLSADAKGDLKPLLKAQVSWIVARQDRAWYALGEAKYRLRQLGWSDDQIFTLDGDWSDFKPAEQTLFRLARNLAAAPIMATDDDVAEALKMTSPREVVQLISYITNRASIDRITEAAGLKLEN